MKVIVTDLDGTLLDSNKMISSENSQALQRAAVAGFTIVVATGRFYSNAYTVCRESGLNPYIISNNGAFVYTPAGELLQSTGLTPACVQPAVDWLQEHGYFFSLCTDREVYVPTNTGQMLQAEIEAALMKQEPLNVKKAQQLQEWIMNLPETRFVDDLRTVAEQVILANISAFSFLGDKLSQGRQHFAQQEGLALSISEEYIFEMIPPMASKGNAVEFLTNQLGVSLREVMAIGDHYNDLSMLERAGWSVAMGNAEAKVKAVSHYIAPSNDCHGVAHAVEKMMLAKASGW